MSLPAAKNYATFGDLFLDHIRGLYDAENRLLVALPKMADAATSADLKAALQAHIAETEIQIGRLESVFNSLGQPPSREACEAMKGLLKEGREVMRASGDAAVKDAALIATAQRVEHYEMASYGAARNYARQLEHPDLAELLQTSLDEEGDSNKRLTQIAEGSINRQAAQA